MLRRNSPRRLRRELLALKAENRRLIARVAAVEAERRQIVARQAIDAQFAGPWADMQLATHALDNTAAELAEKWSEDVPS